MLDIKPTETSILHVNNNSFTGPLIIGTFEKRAPGPKRLETELISKDGTFVHYFFFVLNIPLLQRNTSIFYN